MRSTAPGVAVLAFLFGTLGTEGAEPTRGPEIRIGRASGPITIDGDLNDPGWQGATRLETWYETNPGDNIPSKLKNVAWLTYDDRFLYAAFEFADPDPSKIRAPYGDHDNINGSSDDYGGLILDTNGEAKTATLFLATPRSIQYDAVSDDSSGNEDASPDFYWDAVGRITKEGWQLEIRIPFSTLRYSKADVQKWNVLLYRNYPRKFRYQMFTAKLPRGENCFICHSSPLTGLVGLPAGGHLVAAPYVAAKEEGVPREEPGSPPVNEPIKVTGGLDAKWTPNAVTALDATINPDFSQIESDVAQISANERFALLYPEKRPFFLERVDLIATQIPAVYTRSITSPRWGARGTGKLGETSYTALVTEDRGGGSVILPGPNGSEFAPQDFSSFVAIGRVKQDLGLSFAGLLVTDREIHGGGYNRVVGPDFQWRPSSKDTLTGQLLFSSSENPDRPDLTPSWTGQKLSGHGLDTWYSHSTATWDLGAEYKDFADGFRADDGFVPQVGYRETYGEAGWTFWPTKGPVSRLRPFLIADYSAGTDGALLLRQISPGFGMDGILSSSARIRVAFDRVRAQDMILPRTQLLYTIQFSPSPTISYVALEGFLGEEIDFTGARPGHGGRVTGTVRVRPGIHLELRFDGSLKWLNVRPFEGGDERRLFTAHVERLKATYTFNARSYLRLIGQWQQLDQNPDLYAEPVDARSGSFSGSVLFAYKLNWQTVFFAGYGDNRTLTGDSGLLPAGRQFFVKVSYAFQR